MTITFRDVVSSVSSWATTTTTTTTATTTASVSSYPNIKTLKLKARRTSFPLTGINIDMPSPLLPIELLEAIIDELDDEVTLRACSLVSRTFVYRSQSHLFHTIDLDCNRRGTRKRYHDRFHRLLRAKPHLGMYVRILRLGDDWDDDFRGRRGGNSNDYGEGGHFGENGGWILRSKTLPQTLQMLPRLEGFSLNFNSEMINWKSILPDTRAAIGRLFRLPTLQAVSLEFISDFPVQLLLSLIRLRYLGLSCVEVGSDTASLPGSPPANIQDILRQVASQGRWESQLESLYLRGTSQLTNQAVSHALALSTRPTLKKLSVTPTFEDGFCDTISELINTTGSNITDFEWLPSIHFYSSVGSINVGALSQLRVLRFVISFRKNAHGAFPEVLRLLGQISNVEAEGNTSDTVQNASTRTNQLETIILDCHCIRASASNSSTSRTDEIKTLQSEWRPLDKVLSRPGAFGVLKEVKIRLSTSTSVPASRARFTQAFQHLMPSLQSRGTIISVKTRVDGNERFGLDDYAGVFASRA